MTTSTAGKVGDRRRPNHATSTRRRTTVTRPERCPRVRILGDVCVDGVSVASSRVRALLTRLALAPGEIVSEAALMEAMWPGGAPRSARTALQTHVGALRDLLEPDRARRTDGAFLFRRHGGYLLDLGDELDVSALRHAVDRADKVRSTQPTVAASLLDGALGLWHDDPLAEFEDRDWAAGHATVLAEYATRALVVRTELALETDGHGDAIPRLEAAVASHPYDEQLVALLMVALHRSGRQADALAVYQETRTRLVEELGVEPGPGLREAEREVLLAGEAAPRRQRVRTVTDDGTHFVGRLAVQAQLRQHLGERPLVTLVGPGGVGKTRLARRVVAGVATEWGIDVVFVDLSEVLPGGAATAIAEHVGVVAHPRLDLADAILAAVEERETLLVLDTCEHLLEEVGRVVETLLRDPHLRILATSRSPLHHRSELIIEVDPLATDDAISLLLDRAGLDRVDDADRLALGEICRRLDGLPLAIELAAGRLRTLTPDQLSELLRRGRAELRGGEDRPLRHRNLAETIAWSYELLDEPAQRALRTIAIFRGGFTEAVAASFWNQDGDGGQEGDPGGDRDEAVDPSRLLLDLVDRSLISRNDDHSLRFRALDTVREFALDRSAALGERSAIEDRHAAWVLDRVTASAFGAAEPPPSAFAAEIGPAIDHLAARGRVQELHLVTLLGTWWVEASRMAEGRRRLTDALERHRSAPPVALAPAEALLAFLAWYQGDGRTARQLLERVIPRLSDVGLGSLATMSDVCLAFVEARFDDAEKACQQMLDATPARHGSRLLALFMAGNVALYAGDDELALARYVELRTAAENLGSAYQIGLALRFQALATALCDDVDRAWALAERSAVVAEEEGGLVARTQAQAILGLVTWLAGDLDSALAHSVEAARLSRASFDAFSLRVSLPVVAAVAAERGDDRVAATVVGWLKHLVDDSLLFLAPMPRRIADEAEQTLRERLGDAAHRRLLAQAAGLSLPDLVELVRSTR